MISTNKSSILIIDTHSISEELGGTGTGLISTFTLNKDAKCFIYQRLVKSDPKIGEQKLEIFSIKENKSFPPGDRVEVEDKSCSSQVETICLHTVNSYKKNQQLYESKSKEQEKSDPMIDKQKLKIFSSEATKSLTACDSVEIVTDSCSAMIETDSLGSGNSYSKNKQSSISESKEQVCKNQTLYSFGASNDTSELSNEYSNEQKTIEINSEQESGNKPIFPITNPKDWSRRDMLSWGNSFYVQTANKFLSGNEVLALLKSDVRRSNKVPQRCEESSTFIIAPQKLLDICSDGLGILKHKIDCRKFVVQDYQLHPVCKVSLKRPGKVFEGEDDIFYYVNKRKSEDGNVQKMVAYFTQQQNVLFDGVILQYLVSESMDWSKYETLPHKNSDHGNEYYPKPKSMILEMKKKIINREPASKIWKDLNKGKEYMSGGITSRQTVWNAKSKLCMSAKTDTGIFDQLSIQAFNSEMEDGGDGEFLVHRSIHPYNITILCPPLIKKITKHALQKFPGSIDPTFGQGKEEVTPITIPHPFIESKQHDNSYCPALMCGFTIIHYSKSTPVYVEALQDVKKAADIPDEEKIALVTDGEKALIDAVKAVFPNVVDGRCSVHVRRNLRKFLEKAGLKSVTYKLLDIVFGNNGLIESENEANLHSQLMECKETILTIESSVKRQSKASMFEWLMEREDDVLCKLIRNRRLEGNCITKNGVPVRFYTNNSETTNSVLTAKKKSLNYGNKDDLSTIKFISDVWLSVVDDQKLEVTKAFQGQSANMKLNKEAEYLMIKPSEYF